MIMNRNSHAVMGNRFGLCAFDGCHPGRISMHLAVMLLSSTTIASARAAEKGATLDREWHAIGPFASGKSEYEGDPLAAHGGAHLLYHSSLLSKKRR